MYQQCSLYLWLSSVVSCFNGVALICSCVWFLICSSLSLRITVTVPVPSPSWVVFPLLYCAFVKVVLPFMAHYGQVVLSILFEKFQEPRPVRFVKTSEERAQFGEKVRAQKKRWESIQYQVRCLHYIIGLCAITLSLMCCRIYAHKLSFFAMCYMSMKWFTMPFDFGRISARVGKRCRSLWGIHACTLMITTLLFAREVNGSIAVWNEFMLGNCFTFLELLGTIVCHVACGPFLRVSKLVQLIREKMLSRLMLQKSDCRDESKEDSRNWRERRRDRRRRQKQKKRRQSVFENLVHTFLQTRNPAIDVDESLFDHDDSLPNTDHCWDPPELPDLKLPTLPFIERFNRMCIMYTKMMTMILESLFNMDPILVVAVAVLGIVTFGDEYSNTNLFWLSIVPLFISPFVPWKDSVTSRPQREDESIVIFVELFNGDTLRLQVPFNITVAQLKKLIQVFTRIPIDLKDTTLGEHGLMHRTRASSTQPSFLKDTTPGENGLMHRTRAYSTQPSFLKDTSHGEHGLMHQTRASSTQPSFLKDTTLGENGLMHQTRASSTQPSFLKDTTLGEHGLSRWTRVSLTQPRFLKVLRDGVMSVVLTMLVMP